MLKSLLSGISAGLLISLGGAVFLSCDDKVVGAIFFSLALLCICMKKYVLYTGRIGYLFRDKSKDYFITLVFGLIGNVIGTAVTGIAVRVALPKLIEKANAVCDAKLTQSFAETFIRALLCGVLVYLSVSLFSEKNGAIALVLCIPAFILSGYEHCVADMFYFAVNGLPTLRAVGFIAVAVLGNSVGALILPLLNSAERKHA